MTQYAWRRDRDYGGETELQERSIATSWDEVWTVLYYDPPANVPGWYGLLLDRLDLAPGRDHPTFLGALVTKFDAQPIGTSKAWKVTVTYRNRQPQGFDLPPTQRPAVITTGTESENVPTFTQSNGDAWLNTAGDLITGITKKKTRLRFRVQKNLPAYPAWLLTYDDAVNNDAVIIRGLVVAAGYLLLSDPDIGDIVPETVNGLDYLYYPVSFNLIYDPDTWKTVVYNRGLYQVDAGEYKPCVDSEGEPVTEPAFLDAAGKQLTYPVDPNDIVTLEGWNHNQMPFSALPTT